jgi:dCTP deaminase
MTFWSGQTLRTRAQTEKLIEPFDPALVSCSAYELKVGSEAFVTRDKTDQSEEIKQGRTPGHLVPAPNETICIPSGQFALLITEEKVRIPEDAIGLISMKASKKWMGLINVSGFHVDPGWHDRLIFGVFNAGPQMLVVKPGERFFLLFFVELDKTADESSRYKNGYDFSHIPSRLMQGMSASVPTIYKLNDNVKELREEAKSAQNRSTMSLWVAGFAASLVIASTSITVGVLLKALPSVVSQSSPSPPIGLVAPTTNVPPPPAAIAQPAGQTAAEPEFVEQQSVRAGTTPNKKP